MLSHVSNSWGQSYHQSSTVGDKVLSFVINSWGIVPSPVINSWGRSLLQRLPVPAFDEVLQHIPSYRTFHLKPYRCFKKDGTVISVVYFCAAPVQPTGKTCWSSSALSGCQFTGTLRNPSLCLLNCAYKFFRRHSSEQGCIYLILLPPRGGGKKYDRKGTWGKNMKK
jgi:hypothetical protein